MILQDEKRIKRLLTHAEVAAEFEHISPDLVLLWHELREEFGLSKLLLLIQEYVSAQHKGEENG